MLCVCCVCVCFFFVQAEDGIRDLVRSRGLGDVYKRQELWRPETWEQKVLSESGTADFGSDFFSALSL